jgi:MFS family permease
MLLGVLIALVADSLIPLIASQLLSGASRSVYWSAAQSYISRSAEGQAGTVMGRQLAYESSAGILGGLAAGFVAELFGFQTAFTISAALCVVGLITTSSLPSLPRKDQVRSIKASFEPVKPMLFSRSLAYAHLVSFMAAAHSALVTGLFIAYFRDIGFSEGLTGLVRSLNGVGVVTVAYFFGMLLGRFGARFVGMWGMVLTGVVTIAIALTGSVPILSIVLMTASGMTFGLLRTLYPSLAAEKSPPSQRAMALSVVSLYWAVAMLIIPLIFGFIADAIGIATAMTIFGVFAIAVGMLAPLVYGLDGGNARPGSSRAESAPASPEAARTA